MVITSYFTSEKLRLIDKFLREIGSYGDVRFLGNDIFYACFKADYQDKLSIFYKFLRTVLEEDSNKLEVLWMGKSNLHTQSAYFGIKLYEKIFPVVIDEMFKYKVNSFKFRNAYHHFQMIIYNWQGCPTQNEEGKYPFDAGYVVDENRNKVEEIFARLKSTLVPSLYRDEILFLLEKYGEIRFDYFDWLWSCRAEEKHAVEIVDDLKIKGK